MATSERIRQHAIAAREEAQRTPNPMVKARLHEIANELEKLADELERGAFDGDRRS